MIFNFHWGEEKVFQICFKLFEGQKDKEKSFGGH